MVFHSPLEPSLSSFPLFSFVLLSQLAHPGHTDHPLEWLLRRLFRALMHGLFPCAFALHASVGGRRSTPCHHMIGSNICPQWHHLHHFIAMTWFAGDAVAQRLGDRIHLGQRRGTVRHRLRGPIVWLHSGSGNWWHHSPHLPLSLWSLFINRQPHMLLVAPWRHEKLPHPWHQ